MTRLAIYIVAFALAAQTGAAGPAEVSPKRPNPRPTAAEVARAQFADQDRIQRPEPVSATGSFIFSTHGRNRPR